MKAPEYEDCKVSDSEMIRFLIALHNVQREDKAKKLQKEIDKFEEYYWEYIVEDKRIFDIFMEKIDEYWRLSELIVQAEKNEI